MTVKIKDVTSGYIKEIEALKAERDELAAQNKILLDALNLALPSVETCYKQHMATWETLFLLREAAKATPQQCLRDVQAEAIDNATTYLAESIPDKSHESVIFKDRYVYISTRYLREYAESVRQGGAE